MTAPPTGEGACRYVISLVTADRPGIVKCLTAAVVELGGNINGLSQTTVHGYFTVILTVEFEAAISAEQLREAILAACPWEAVGVVALPYMVAPPLRTAAGAQRYVLTAVGPDRRGMLHAIAGFLYARDINIEDYAFTWHDGQVTHVAELSLPATLEIGRVQEELQPLMAELALEATLQHDNLFRAVNDVFAIRQLLRETTCSG